MKDKIVIYQKNLLIFLHAKEIGFANIANINFEKKKMRSIESLNKYNF